MVTRKTRRTVASSIVTTLVLGPLAFVACSSSSSSNGDSLPGAGDATFADANGDASNNANDASGNDAGVEKPVPPAAAVAAGFTELVFDQGGNAGWDIDTAQTNKSGHDWYTSGGFFGANDASTQLGDGGVLTIASGGMASATRIGSGPDAGYVGHAFGDGFYVEASLALTPGCSTNGIVSAFWGLPVEKEEKDTVTDQWPGQPAGYVHYSELDFMEFHIAVAKPPSTSFYVLDWYGEYSGDTPSCMHPGGNMGFCACGNNGGCAAAPANGADDLDASTDFSAFNVYGSLVVPAQKNTPDSGYLQGFFDGTKTPSSLRWDPYDAAIDPAPVRPQVFAVTDIDHFYLIANTTAGCPMSIAYVRVWQRP